MTKKVIILKSSPRNQSNSSFLADKTAKGAQEAGAQVETFNLHDMDIRPCDACDSCMETDGVCVISDDMQTLYPKIQNADVVVISGPIYWFTINAQAKLCIDRWYAFEGMPEKVWPGKKLAVILTYGDSDPYNSGAVNALHTFESICRYTKAELAGMVYGTAHEFGEAEKQPDLVDKAYKLGQKLVI
jgi:multimeric flavodoxin WrbA